MKTSAEEKAVARLYDLLALQKSVEAEFGAEKYNASAGTAGIYESVC
ncbi:MAG: hypothetical protein IJZ82_01050 [Lachnospiraceae bacterium]|nr:hypothetical protein [Lachnospiraceae bacterium]